MHPPKLMLRVLPDVNFVHGYPGIAPSSDRPLATVQGYIQIKTKPGGVQAKWIRVELRKAETLPGGGTSNTFYDTVVRGPVTLWDSKDDPGRLSTHDFNFSLCIPEAIPPTIALKNQAGVNYELVASLCTKGKKRFLRKRKWVVVTNETPVEIDKHEMHSNWPVYCQQSTLRRAQDGCTLVVDRCRTCYGPGDRICVVATLKSDELEDTLLREFQIVLREKTAFYPGPRIASVFAAPKIEASTICSSKLSINGALYVGAQHKAELTCTIPSSHSTSSLNTARYIEITYILTVRAILIGRPPIVLDLPVTVTNWPRKVSLQATRKIGPAPNLSFPPNKSSSLPPPLVLSPNVKPNSPAAPSSSRTTRIDIEPPTSSRKSMLPPLDADFSRGSPLMNFDSLSYKTPSLYSAPSRNGSLPSIHEARIAPWITHAPSTKSTASLADSLPSENLNEVIESPRPSGSGASLPTPRRIQEQQSDQAAKLEDAVAGGSNLATRISIIQATRPNSMSPLTALWMSAEEEKVKLFNQAQSAATKTQTFALSPPPYRHADLHDNQTNLSHLSLMDAAARSDTQTLSPMIYPAAISASTESFAVSLASHRTTSTGHPRVVPRSPLFQDPGSPYVSNRGDEQLPAEGSSSADHRSSTPPMVVPVLPEPEILRPKPKRASHRVSMQTLAMPPPYPFSAAPDFPALPTLPTASSSVSDVRVQRPLPIPPYQPGRIMVASEEKALLEALYMAQAEDARTKNYYENNSGAHHHERRRGVPIDSPGGNSNWNEDTITLGGRDTPSEW